MEKENVVYIYNHYYSALKKESLPFVTWIHLEDIMLSEISQTQENKYHMISHIV